MLRQKKFLIGGIILFLAIGYLAFIGFQGAATYYYTVSELIGEGDSVYGENVRVNGRIESGSVEQNTVEGLLKFTITDEEGGLPVVYRGVVPDAFRAGNMVVIEGYIRSDGIFQAHTLMVKCPSKYIPEE
ncbi:cytochrome c maturation protein CcmE [Chloroflexota bacterium]